MDALHNATGRRCSCEFDKKTQWKQVNDLVTALQLCKDLQQGKTIHSQIVQSGQECNIYLASTLVNMYSRCGSLTDAGNVFDRMPRHNVVPWTSLILGHAENGKEERALELFSRLSSGDTGLLPNSQTFLAALSACSRLAAKEDVKRVGGRCLKLASLEKTMAVHSEAVNCGFVSDIFVASTLVHAYAQTGDMVGARDVFDRMQTRNVVSWNSLLLGYAENDEEPLSLEAFLYMNSEGCQPDARTFVAVVKACANMAVKEEAKEVDGKCIKLCALEKGLAFHSQAGKAAENIFVANTLIDMYTKCGSLLDAERVFNPMPSRSIVTWTAMMLGCADNGEEELALQLFACMRLAGCSPNSRTYVAAIKACTNLAAREVADVRLSTKVTSLEKGMAIHSQAARSSCMSEMFVANSLVDFYGKCGSMEDASRVFYSMQRRNLVSWTALVIGYAELGEADLALELFSSMQRDGYVPDNRALAGLLKACGLSLETVRAVHAEVLKLGLETDTVLTNMLVDVYGKCGGLLEAQQVFNAVCKRDSVTWTALVAGYSQHGDVKQVLKLFQEMEAIKGLRPNAVTLGCVLTACAHAGLVEKGKGVFQTMSLKHGVQAGVEHYVCMVDILGRANELEAAMELLETMPFRSDVVAWRTLLGACEKWKNVELGELAFERLVKLECGDASAYNLMANIYKKAT